MEIFADYHTHTIYSHGKGTIRDNVEMAIEKGLKKIAITDHGPKHLLFGVKRENFKKMRSEIDKLNQEYKEIDILLGVEANIISGNGDIDIDDEIAELLDILLVGFHYASKTKTIKDAWNMYVLNSEKFNTKAMINAINKYDINIITHPGAKANVDIIEIAKAAAKRDTALEINSKHGHLSVNELKSIVDQDVKFIIGSDAHCKEDVGNVKEGIDRAIEAEIDKSRILNII